MSYKKDIDDLRESPTLKLMEILERKGAHVDYNDPYFLELHPMRHYSYEHKKSVEITAPNLARYDAVLISTNHSLYDWDFIVKHSRVVVDTRNATARVKEGREKIYKA